VVAVIDDNPVNRLLVRRALEGVAEISEFASMAYFLDAVDDVAPDMAFLDLMMPGEDIPALLATLAESKAELVARIIVLTADPRLPEADAAAASGIIGVVERPFLKADFIALLNMTQDRMSGGRL
tara:strand:+ start:8626 stop:9000 length:375 start_codon:yes stop_codon:yes gene_type:complete